MVILSTIKYLPSYNLVDHGLVNSIFLGQHLLSIDPKFIFFSYLVSFVLVQFSLKYVRLFRWVRRIRSSDYFFGSSVYFILFARKIKSALFHRIMNVVFWCPKKKMIWANTLGVVAFMQYPKAIYNWTNKMFVNSSMSPNSFSFYLNFPIPIGPCLADPYPTRFGFFNLRKKPFSEILLECHWLDLSENGGHV